MTRQNFAEGRWLRKVYSPSKSDMPDNWPELRKACLDRDHRRCLRCGSKAHLTAHHIRPRSKGGTNALSNLMTLCGICHDYIEMHGIENVCEILCLDSDEVELIDTPELDREETFERPEWHPVVYGGVKRSRKTRKKAEV